MFTKVSGHDGTLGQQLTLKWFKEKRFVICTCNFSVNLRVCQYKNKLYQKKNNNRETVQHITSKYNICRTFIEPFYQMKETFLLLFC